MTERRNLLQESLAAISRLQARLEAAERAARAPIAIIGAGCRYAGGVEDPAALWRLLRDGVDAVDTVPAARWDADAYYDADPAAPGKMVTRRGGFLRQVDGFDPQFFGISPREAKTMDPQQRLLLECAYEALESAGIAPDSLAGSPTGVYIGITTSDYAQMLRIGGPDSSDVYSATGSALNAAAGRISFTLGLQGPCIALDTACSSSLAALHLACQGLRNGESSLALAGGVNVVLSPDAMVLFSKWGMMAPDGACKTFDAAADGFVRAEGCAVIALKRLSDALEAGDPVLAVIRGSAVNSDGRSSGLTVPSGPAQQAVVRAALASAGLQPADIDYVEAHGTGTPLGDPIEVEALGAVLGRGRAPDRPLLIGSIKTNIGHAEAASGVAGLLKVVLALRHETIPPHLHLRRLNPGIAWDGLGIGVPTVATPWPSGARPRRAGVSSFGFSGTNAHVIVEEAPRSPEPDAETGGGERTTAWPMLLSGRDDAALRDVARRLADFLDAGDAVDAPTPRLADVAATLAIGRAHQGRRVAWVCESLADLRRDLRALAAGSLPAGAQAGSVQAGTRQKIGFLFTGQGSAYAGMGRGLYDSEPVFRAVIDRAATVLGPLLDRPLTALLFGGPQTAPDAAGDTAADAADPLARTAFAQPALFALEYALVQLWRSWGVTPSVLLGHSVGEYVAACVAGVFDFEEALALVAERGRLMQALPDGGAMAAVFCGLAELEPLIAPHAERLAVAGINGPKETVLAGDAQALATVTAALDARGIQSRPLRVSHAFHSPLLDPMLGALEARAATVPHGAPQVPLVSNLTGALFPNGSGPDARYWARHARQPVQFAAALRTLRGLGVTQLVELGPHPTLLSLAARAEPDATWRATPSLRQGRPDRRAILDALVAVHAGGAAVRWAEVGALRGGRRIALPTYPFQRERCWIDVPPARRPDTTTPHDARTGLAAGPGVPAEWYHEVAWQRLPLAGPSLRPAQEGPWLVFADARGIGAEIARQRAAAGAATWLVLPSDRFELGDHQALLRPGHATDFRALLGALPRPAVVLNLWATDAHATADGSADGSADGGRSPSAGDTLPDTRPDSLDLASGPADALRLLQAVLDAPGRPGPRLWFATAGARRVLPEDRCDAPQHATLWGLCGALAAEHAALWGGLVDIDPAVAPADAARRLMAEIAHGASDDKTAWRGADRFVSRLRHRSMRSAEASPGLSLQADATYVVTGGLGGIGLAIARWLAERGARRLLLLGRTAGPVDAASPQGIAVAAIEASGARVETLALDIGRPGSFQAALAARAARGCKPVRGVVHAAGVLQFQALESQDPSTLDLQLAAKAQGAWQLHRALADVPLDFFVLCASTSALLESPLLGGYAAGNAFLDALAHHRRARGLVALSVDWGTWGEVGMAVAPGRDAGAALPDGVGTIGTAQGLQALDTLLREQAVQAAVMPTDWKRLVASRPSYAVDPFFEALVERAAAAPAPGPTGTSWAALQRVDRAARPALLTGHLRAAVAQVLGMDPDRLDPDAPLTTLGFDSLMAVQLKNRIATDLEVQLPMSRFLEGPSVAQLSASILASLHERAAEPPPSGQGPVVATEEQSWEEGSL